MVDLTSPTSTTSQALSPPQNNNGSVSWEIMISLIFITHCVVNALLISSLNPRRCLFWDQEECSADEAWALNWFVLSHVHLATVLGCIAFSIIQEEENQQKSNRKFKNENENNNSNSNYNFVTDGIISESSSFVYLCCIIIICYMIEGIFSLKILNKSYAAFQCLIFLMLLWMVLHWTTNKAYWDNQQQQIVASSISSQSRSSRSFMNYSQQSSSRRRLLQRSMSSSSSLSFSISNHRENFPPIPTMALTLQVLMTAFRVVDATFGSTGNTEGYTGDTSSPIFENILQMNLCDTMMIILVFVYSIYFGSTEQQKYVLIGHASVGLFVSQIMLATNSQGEMLSYNQIRNRMVGNLINIVLSFVGSIV